MIKHIGYTTAIVQCDTCFTSRIIMSTEEVDRENYNENVENMLSEAALIAGWAVGGIHICTKCDRL